MKKVFVFGNTLIEKDRLAHEVVEKLKRQVEEIEFEAVESFDDIETTEDLYIIDVCLGLEKVETLEDIDRLEAKHPVSGHDFDLALELKVRKKIGRIGNVKIIAIPVDYPLEKAVVEVKEALEKL
tara:strand:+ start:197 stop:571 length:375 start_codon:yes stop_codon:yes gene_type:complete